MSESAAQGRLVFGVVVPDDRGAALPRSDTPGKADGLPAEVSSLLAAVTHSEREASWERFVHRYSRLLLHTVHARSNGYDEAMDRYAFVLQGLKANGYRRLRGFDQTQGARFTTWLVVVTGRLCIDYFRTRYGERSETEGSDGDWRVEFRRNLADLLPAAIDLTRFADGGSDPELDLRRAELHGALDASLAELDGRDRFLLRLRFHEGMSAREIAELMDYPSLFHVYRRLKKVLATLRVSLRARGVGQSQP